MERDKDRDLSAVREALRLAAEQGASGEELERIARRTGMPRSLLRRTARDTSDVMDGLLFSIYERLMAVLDHAACRDDDPLHALDRIFDSHVGFVSDNPAVAKLLRHVLGKPHPRMHAQVEKIMRLYEREVVVLVQEAKIKGLVVDGTDSHAVATVFVSLIQAQVLRLQILADPEAVRAESRKAWRVFVAGIRVN